MRLSARLEFDALALATVDSVLVLRKVTAHQGGPGSAQSAKDSRQGGSGAVPGRGPKGGPGEPSSTGGPGGRLRGGQNRSGLSFPDSPAPEA